MNKKEKEEEERRKEEEEIICRRMDNSLLRKVKYLIKKINCVFETVKHFSIYNV
jgi:hypothetical protein